MCWSRTWPQGGALPPGAIPALPAGGPGVCATDREEGEEAAGGQRGRGGETKSEIRGCLCLEKFSAETVPV